MGKVVDKLLGNLESYLESNLVSVCVCECVRDICVYAQNLFREGGL